MMLDLSRLMANVYLLRQRDDQGFSRREPIICRATGRTGGVADGRRLVGTKASAPAKPCWCRQPRPHRAHGKRPRREIVIVVAGRNAHHARRLVVHLHPSQQQGPMLSAYAALLALPSFARL